MCTGCHTASQVTDDTESDSVVSGASDFEPVADTFEDTASTNFSAKDSDTDSEKVADTDSAAHPDTAFSTDSDTGYATESEHEFDTSVDSIPEDTVTAIDSDSMFCDSENAANLQEVYLDLDSDGDVGITPSFCVVAGQESYPEAFRFYRGWDCNDTSAEFSVYRPDLQGDGIDHDCDGKDDVFWCDVYHTSCDELDVPPPVDNCPGGIDLVTFVAYAIRAQNRSDRGYIYIVNNGSEAYSGRMEFVREYDETYYPGLDFDAVTAAPNPVYAVSMMPGDIVYVAINPAVESVGVNLLDGTDCFTDNNHIAVEWLDLLIE